MKANAWVHHRTAQLAAQAADAGGSGQAAALTALSAEQTRAFVADYGLPKELPAADTAQEVLAAGGALAGAALADAQRRPDPWETADAIFELGIGVAGVVGGVYGVRLARLMQQAREKSAALREVVEGNELFKRSNPDAAGAFKEAQAGQSPETRRLVAELKG